MRRRRRPANRSPASYLSSDPAKRARQLQNLGPHPGRRPLHGAYAQLAPERIEAKVAEVFEAVAADAPLRDRDGGLPAADGVAVRMLAECLCRLETVTAHLRDFGVLDQQTREVRPAVHVEAKLRREVADWLDALGMTPRARAKLGLDVARATGGAFDLARHLADVEDEAADG
jgi:phage terminase small subunit